MQHIKTQLFCTHPQESQCQTLPAPSVPGHQHGRLSGLIRIREPGRPEPVLQAGVGEPASVGRVTQTLTAAPSPPSSPRGRQAQGHRSRRVTARREHARRLRAGRQRCVPPAVDGSADGPQQEVVQASPPPSPSPEQGGQPVLMAACEL